MSQVQVFLADARLAVRTPFLLKDKCKTIPGYKWHPEQKVWTYPATPSAAREIHQAFPDGTATWQPDAAALLLEAERIAQQAVLKEADHLPPPPLTASHKPLWRHQIRAYHFAAPLSAAMLAMEMRTGKTRVAIDLLQNRGSRLILVVAPNKVLEGAVWAEQFQEYCVVPHMVLTLWNDPLDKRAAILTQQIKLARIRAERLIVCVNYEAVWREPLARILLQTAWDSVVLDESHRIKKAGGKSSLFFSRLADLVPHRLCLTGTPMAHSPLDVYGQYRFLDKGIFGTNYTNFRARYAVMSTWNRHVIDHYQHEDDLKQRFYTIAFRVRTEDVLDLPEKQDIVRYCQLAPYAQQLYKELDEEFVADVGEGRVTAANAMTRLLRLQQLTGGYLRQDRDIESGADGVVVQVDTSKRELLADLLDNLSETEPVVVYCRFHHDLDAVHEVAAALGRSSSEVSGRKSDMKEWQHGKTTILAVQIQSGSEGNDFSRAHYMFFYSVGYSLYQFEQAYMRIRSGSQQHQCTYYYLVARGTKDEAVYEALRDRRDVVEAVLQQVKR